MVLSLQDFLTPIGLDWSFSSNTVCSKMPCGAVLSLPKGALPTFCFEALSAWLVRTHFTCLQRLSSLCEFFVTSFVR